MKEFLSCQPVSIEEMLEARERRANKQQMLLAQIKNPLVCFTLNIPGEYKQFPLATRCFYEGTKTISLLLSEERLAITHSEEYNHKTGSEAFFSVDGNAGKIKELLLPLEENHQLGRLFDIDVIGTDGKSLKRIDFGREGRKCFICDNPVWMCARNRTHSSGELVNWVVSSLKAFFDGQMADRVAQEAVNALISEVCISPKPGLVDRFDNGSHNDMDIFTFIDSGCALFSYFRDIFLLCTKYCGSESGIIKAIRYRGIIAEKTMLAKTKGVNTHKGAIFSLGLICASIGHLYGEDEAITMQSVLKRCSAISQNTLINLNSRKQNNSHGEKVFHEYGLSGIRGEAATGFKSVTDFALPALNKLMSSGYTVEQAGIVALLHLLAHVEDTNIVARSDVDKLRAIQRDVRVALEKENYQYLHEYAIALNSHFIASGVSPGGCADLLAVTLFINSYFNSNNDVLDNPTTNCSPQ